MNLPTSPLLDKEITAFLGRLGGKDISGMSASVLMNFLAVCLIFGAPLSDIKEAKATACSSGPCRRGELHPAMRGERRGGPAAELLRGERPSPIAGMPEAKGKRPSSRGCQAKELQEVVAAEEQS